MRRGKFTKETKLAVVLEYLSGKASSCELARKAGSCHQEVLKWVTQYKSRGSAAFDERSANQSYTAEFKLMVVEEYLSGTVGLLALAAKHNIPDKRQVRDWIKKYNSHDGKLKPYKAAGGIDVTRGRKTTYEERIEIVEDCLKNGENYKATSVKYKVSYTQVYSWVNKYREKGVAALKDSRGRGKAPEAMNELERLDAENKLLKARLEAMEMEIELKKKLLQIQLEFAAGIRKKR